MGSKRWGSGARVDDPKTGKRLLLRAAIQCFVTKGMKATTIEDVAEAANVTRRTVYRYYAGKQELIAAVIQMERTRMFARLAEVVEPLAGNFARIVEECIVFTARYHPPEEGKSDLVSGDNAAEAKPHIEDPESAEEWRKVMQPHYDAYRAEHSDVGALEDIIELIGRLVLAYRQLPADEENMRRSIRAMLSVSAP